jgi:hypothetical protein
MAVIDLGLDPATWQLYSLRDIAGLMDRRATIREREVDFPTARILHALWNIHCRGKGDPEFEFDQFLLNKPFKEESLEEQQRIGMEFVKNWVVSLGGSVNL